MSKNSIPIIFKKLRLILSPDEFNIRFVTSYSNSIKRTFHLTAKKNAIESVLGLICHAKKCTYDKSAISTFKKSLNYYFSIAFTRDDNLDIFRAAVFL